MLPCVALLHFIVRMHFARLRQAAHGTALRASIDSSLDHLRTLC